MKLLTKNTDYAVRALVLIALGDREAVSAASISRKEKIPYAYLRRILNELKEKGVLSSTEGKGGGFVLAGKAADVRLTDVMKIFQGEMHLTGCMFRKKICHNRAKCVMRAKLLDIEKKVLKEIEGVTIQSIINDTKRRHK